MPYVRLVISLKYMRPVIQSDAMCTIMKYVVKWQEMNKIGTD